MRDARLRGGLCGPKFPRLAATAGHDFRPVAFFAPIYYKCSTTSVEIAVPAAETDVALSELQIAVMRVLWRQGETSVADVAAVLAEERGIKYTTVATLLTRLEKRGVVKQRREGRQLVYRALASEPQVRRSMVADLLGSLFGGDARALVAHLVSESEIAPGDIERVRKRLAKGTRRGD